MEHLSTKSLESEITFIGQGTRLKGTFIFDRFTRIHGEIDGKVTGLPGSLIVIGETGSVHGEMHGAEIIIDGFMKGNVYASEKLTISSSGKLVGDIYSPKMEIQFGAYFEGKAITKHESRTTVLSQPNLALNPSEA